MNCYISGPIRSRPNGNREAFLAAAAWCCARGLAPLNPHDLRMSGVEIRQKLAMDLHWMLTSADCVLALRGAARSPGAMAEMHSAAAADMPEWDWEALIRPQLSHRRPGEPPKTDAPAMTAAVIQRARSPRGPPRRPPSIKPERSQT